MLLGFHLQAFVRPRTFFEIAQHGRTSHPFVNCVAGAMPPISAARMLTLRLVFYQPNDLLSFGAQLLSVGRAAIRESFPLGHRHKVFHAFAIRLSPRIPAKGEFVRVLWKMLPADVMP